MKKWVCCVSLLAILLVGCQPKEERITLKATVIEVDEQTMLIDSENSKYIIQLENVKEIDDDIKVGDKIILYHDGIIMESEPAQFARIYEIEKDK